jgi:hypothetical protein
VKLPDVIGQALDVVEVEGAKVALEDDGADRRSRLLNVFSSSPDNKLECLRVGLPLSGASNGLQDQ